MTTFTKTNLRDIRKDLNEALKIVEQKHGITLSIGNIRFTESTFRCKIEAQANSTAVIAESSGVASSTALAAVMERMGLQHFGAGRFSNYKLVDYKPSRPKYPFVIEGPQGGRYKLGRAEALAHFRAA